MNRPDRDAKLSIPATVRPPRELTHREVETLRLVADTLIPARGDAPAASVGPEFLAKVSIALDARADAFEDIVLLLNELSTIAPVHLWTELRLLHERQPSRFQALSTVVAGAWLLTSNVRDRIGYHGQRVDKARPEDVVDEFETGILDPVMNRDYDTNPRWLR
jgi:hypothetical protein